MKKQVRRYNFIYNHHLVYSGLFERVGLFGGARLRKALINKKYEIAVKYKVNPKLVIVSNTVKG